jgi:hypothetical protein
MTARRSRNVIAACLIPFTVACNSAFVPVPDWSGGRPDCPDPSFRGGHDIVEAGRMDQSGDSCWWLSSGAVFTIIDGTGWSLHGALPPGSMWRERYARWNPVDTDDGAHPQNLLRLVARTHWRDFRQEMRFRIARINRTDSPQRGPWSGVFLLHRYRDADNLYYAGLRMDGRAVIKKKLHGRYVTLAVQPVYGTPDLYDRDRNPSLLPAGRWIGMASVVRNEPDGSVRIALYTRDEDAAKSAWTLAVEAMDDGRSGAPIREPGHAGLRSDFMDVEFAGYFARNQ